jgi:hypothetical protein
VLKKAKAKNAAISFASLVRKVTKRALGKQAGGEAVITCVQSGVASVLVKLNAAVHLP